MSALLKLLRSMRFAIAILTVVAVAATIGSVLEQNQPTAVYISRYGEFWAAFYALCGLVDAYHTWWFFALLAFMASSTALCLWQNTPAMLRDMRSYRERKSVASLRNLEHSVELDLAGRDDGIDARLRGYLDARGFSFRQMHAEDGAVMLAGRRGAARRIGYLLVHGAMVLICIGGLIDGNAALRLRLWTGAVRAETRDLAPAEVPATSRLDADAGSFRATMSLPEGKIGNTALLPMGDGYLLQELPFQVRLKRFRIEHYPNGQPKDFASDIEILDGGQAVPVTLRVNRPYTHRGVTMYQSGFADGGSGVTLDLLPLAGPGAQRVEGKVGAGTPVLLNGEPYTLELTDLRATNVFARDDAQLPGGWNSRAVPGARVRDVGPSLAFQLRDKLGQADEWLVYQKPVAIDGASWFLLGRRGQQDAAMQYLRLPADGDASLATYRRLVQALGQPAARRQAARLLAAGVADPRLAHDLELSAAKLLDAFAARGFRAVADLVPAAASRDEQMKTGRLFASLLEKAAAGLAPGTPPALVHASLSAYSDALDARLPAIFQLAGFRQVNASAIQLTRAPGANLVYLGAALLALGVIAMYFVPERRLWLRIGGGKLLLAFAANRPGPAMAAEFDGHRAAIHALTLLNR
jgi:cytochrome c biogenesis protein